MRDEGVFPTFGIDGKNFWRRCSGLAPYVRAIFDCEFAEDEQGADHFSEARHQPHAENAVPFSDQQGLLDMSEDVNDHMAPGIRPIPFPNMIYLGDGPTDVLLHRDAEERPACHRGL
ncbi:MAG: hypothetical protein ABI540_09455 [Spartobacteria bacterium]